MYISGHINKIFGITLLTPARGDENNGDTCFAPLVYKVSYVDPQTFLCTILVQVSFNTVVNHIE